MRIFGSLMIWILMAAVVVLGQNRPNFKPSSQPSSGLKSVCLGNLMRLTLDKALAVGNQLGVEAINGSEHILLTPTLAAQCGYSMESDPWGYTSIYVSLMGCYVDNQEDETFKIGLRLSMYSQSLSEEVNHEMTKTCRNSHWASQEILCDRNYMEVSNHMVTPDTASEAVEGQDSKLKDDSRINAVPGVTAAAYGIWKMTFYTPEPVVMTLREAQQAGYGAMTTPNRLVMRSHYNTAETYSEDVAGVPMEVFKVSTYYKAPHGLTVVDSAVACPTGGLIFTEDMITWHVPRYITPLINSDIQILEMHMGIDGQRLAKTQMAARHYTLSATESHIIIEVPVGSPDGYYKSHAPDYQYHITYTVEPMLELLWRAEDTQADTKYKVLFPVTTPLMPRPPKITDETIPEKRVFDIHLGTFLHDVELVNITFSTGVMSAAECNVQEHKLSNGSKTFSLQVPFSHKVVLKHNPEPLVTVYSLPMTFGLLILPEQTPFPYSTELEASLQDVVMPSITGNCDQKLFYISVKYGSQGLNFETMIGTRQLTPELAADYKLIENGTHMSIMVSYTAPDTVFELIQSSFVKARIDLLLWESNNNWKLSDFSLACNFPLTTTTCYSNGTVTALAVKVESVPNLIPGQLTLNDPSCKPFFSDDRFAQFSFSVTTCGTTRTFFDNYMLYENEIALYHRPGKGFMSPVDPEYRHIISCYYLVNDTETLEFHSRQRHDEPTAETGTGQLMVELRLAQDESYEQFYRADDYPVVKYLREPLCFEVELRQSTDPNIELILDNCWATLHEDRTSLPSWDIIVDSCENLDDRYTTIFHPVVKDARVSIPAHVKRFSIKMFAFIRDDVVLKDQIFVHCDAVICEANNLTDGVCSGQCVRPKNMSRTSTQRFNLKRGRRSANSTRHKKEYLSSGPILLSNLEWIR